MSNWQQLESKVKQYLCPPGNGVFYRQYRQRAQGEPAPQSSTAVPTTSSQPGTNNWHSCRKTSARSFWVSAADTGGGILRGANWGPLFLRQTLVSGNYDVDYFDVGDIRVIPHLLHDKYLNEETISNCRKALYQDAHSPLPVSFAVNHRGFLPRVSTPPSRKRGCLPSAATTRSAIPWSRPISRPRKSRARKVALIHFDAHTDLLVERLGIDICFGSWVTHILNDLPSPDLAIQFGIRSSGRPAEHWEGTFGVKQYWAGEIIERGAETVVDETIAKLKASGVEELYVSFDIDALDAHFAAATGTRKPTV